VFCAEEGEGVHAQVLVGQMHEIWIQKTRLFERQSTILNEISFLLIVFKIFQVKPEGERM
jgi:hypothetical protein